MTKLVINDNKDYVIPKSVENGQVRANERGDLILISGVTNDKYMAITLRDADDHLDEFESTTLNPMDADFYMDEYPHVLGVKITVDVINANNL